MNYMNETQQKQMAAARMEKAEGYRSAIPSHVRVGEVSCHIDSVSASVMELESVLQRLGEKLVPITRQVEGKLSGVGVDEPRPTVEMAIRLYDIRVQIDNLIRRVNEQIDLTEL